MDLIADNPEELDTKTYGATMNCYCSCDLQHWKLWKHVNLLHNLRPLIFTRVNERSDGIKSHPKYWNSLLKSAPEREKPKYNCAEKLKHRCKSVGKFRPQDETRQMRARVELEWGILSKGVIGPHNKGTHSKRVIEPTQWGHTTQEGYWTYISSFPRLELTTNLVSNKSN